MQMTRNRHEAEELVQEAFVRAWTHLPRFQGSSSFFTWIYRIVHNLAIDRFRYKKRRRSSEFDERFAVPATEVGVGYTAAAKPSAFDLAASSQMRELVQTALDTLSENHRQILLMREVQDLSYEEIAQALGVPKGTVMSRLFHARKRLLEVTEPMLEKEGLL
jgi:RNA polymerase sigma-70 factor (ECF subfamily)